ncbi:MAG: cytochrome C biogenesis protein [Calditrichaeota bacterium]|nr:cytochrome C biogenesis protein [Calditrichota bacterium]
MRAVLEWLSLAMGGSPALALVGAFLWGLLSILVSPCHLASIPLVVGFIDGQGHVTTRRAFVLALVFATGILLTIALVGVLTSLAGRMLGDLGAVGNYVVAVIFFAIGLYLLGVMDVPWLGGGAHPSLHRGGLLAALVIGLLFGLALGPCTFAFMAPMLGVVFKVATSNVVYAISLVLAYAVGHCFLIVLAGTFTGAVQNYLQWSERSRTTVVVRRICGVLVIVGGLYLLWTAA